MIRQQRKLHLIAWVVMVPALVVFVTLAILNRTDETLSEAPFAQEALP